MTASLVVPDPYQALQVPRNATQATIKRSYRELARKFHPDRLTQASANEREKATTQFAAIASAYALLSDPQRKAQYDHIYKYGGYDEPDLQEGRHRTSRRAASSSEAGGASCANSSDATDPTSNHQHYHPNNNLRKRKKATGIGYSCVDPLAFLWTNGRVQSQRAVAGIEIPSRLQHAAGLRFLRHTCRPPSQPPQERQDRETPPLPLLLPHINGNRTPLNSFMGKSTRAWKRLPGMPMDGKKSLSKTMTIKTIEPAESAGTSFIRIRRHPKTTTTTHRHNNHNNNIINHNRQSKSLEEHGIHPPRRGTHTLGTDSRTNSPCVTTPALWWHNETRGTCVGGLVVWPMPYLPWQMSSARPEVIFFL